MQGLIRLRGFGIVTGFVLDDQDHPVFGADIEVTSNRYVNDGLMCQVTSGVSHRIRTDQNGRFRIPAVNLGPVGIRVSQAFFPTVIVGDTKTIVHPGDTVDFQVRLVNTMAGVLSGTVFLPDGVTPAGAGVEVTARGSLPDVMVRTDDAGRYRFAKILPEGHYTLTAADPVTGGRQQQGIFLKRVENAEYNLRLKGRGSVTVHVVDAAGVPVDEAYVRLKETEFPSNSYERAITTSGADVAVFQRVFEGPITIEVSDAFSRGGRASSNVPGDGANVEVTVRLSMTGNITGHVLMPDRTTPIPYAIVNLIAGNRTIGQVTTDGSGDVGKFSFDYVPAGSFRLEMLDPATARTGVATGTIATQNQDVVVDVIAQALGTVQGTVTGNGPQPGALVTLQSGTFRVDTITDVNGQYRVTGVPEGLVVATAALDTANFLRGTASASLIGEGGTLTLDVALRASGAVNGQLQKWDGAVPPPTSLITIVGTGTGGGRQQTVTQADGTFAFTRVPSGPATITAAALDGVDQARTVVTVPEYDTAAVTVKLNGVGFARIQARDSLGAAVAGVVTVSSAQTAPFPYSRTVTTDASGVAVVPELLAGDVTIRLTVTDGPIARYGTTTSTIQRDVETPIEVTLQPSGTIVGHVVRADGVTPAIGADVRVRLLGQGGLFTINADENGRFEAQGVPIGPFELNLHDKVSNGSAFKGSLTLAGNGDTVDTGTIVLDDSAVEVLAVEPVQGALNVSVTQPVRLTFSDPLESSNGISVRLNGGAVASNFVSLSTDRLTATINPRNPSTGQAEWPDQSDLDVEVTTAARDIFGRNLAQAFTSRFHTQDRTAPRVTSIAPVDGSLDVDPATAITVTFTEPIAAATIDGVVTLQAVSGIGTGAVAGAATLSAPNVLTFTPSASLAGSTRYAIAVAHAVDLSGNLQTLGASASFTTPDTVAPTLTLMTPPNGGKTNQAQPFVRIDFADAASGVVPSTLHVTLGGVDYTSALTVTATSATFRPATLEERAYAVAATIEDRAGNTGTLAASFTVEFDPVGSVTGHLLLPDGTPAPAGYAVQLRNVSSGIVADQTTDASGSFRFDNLPLQVNHYVTANNEFGRLRARAPGYIYLQTRGQVMDVTARLQGEGTVTGHVFDPEGLPLPNVTVALQSQNAALGTASYTATSDATGEYQVDTVPEGPVAVSAYVAAGPWRGNASGTLVRNQSLTLDIQLLAPTPLTFPVSRRDGNNYLFSINRTGASGNDFLLDIVSNGVATRFEGSTDAQLANDDREVVLRQANLAGLDVTRKVFVPADGYFARYIERLTNPGSSPVTVSLRVTSTVSSSSGYHPDIVLTSSGDQVLQAGTPVNADRWFTIDDETDGEFEFSSSMSALGFLLDGSGGASQIGAAALAPGESSRLLTYEWQQVTIEPGETVSFLHFGVQQPSRAGGEASMRRLEQLPPEALAGLEPGDVDSIHNFVMPPDGVSVVEPLGSMLNTVTGRVLAGDGVTPVADAEVRFKSLHPLFGRTHKVQSNSAGYFGLTGVVDPNGISRLIPHAPFELMAKHPGTDAESPVVTGTFAENESTANVDIVFVDTGVLYGTVRGFAGASAPFALVTVYYNTYQYLTSVYADEVGRYVIAGLWPSTFRLEVRFEHPQGSDVAADVTADVTANTATQADIVPIVGGITGTIVDSTGAPVVGRQLLLTTGNFFAPAWSTTTDAEGRYTFANVPAGPIPLSAGNATEPDRPTVEVLANQVVTQDFTFLGTGTLVITVTQANGTAVPSATVYLRDSSGGERYVGSTNATGTLTLTDVKIGAYVVRAYEPSGVQQLGGTAPVTLDTHGQSVPVTVTLPPAGTLTGRITFPDGSPASASVGVQLASEPESQAIFAYTNGTGHYTIAKVWANAALTVTAASGSAVRTASTTVAAGATQTLDITLPAQAFVQVHVQRADGSPIGAVQLRLEGGTHTDSATTDSNGDALFYYVPEGAFVVRTVHGTGQVAGAVTSADHGQTIPLTLTEGAMSRLTVSTTAGDGVTVITNTYVDVYDAGTNEYIASEYVTEGTSINVPAGRNLLLYASYFVFSGVSTSATVTSAAADETTSISIAFPLAVITGHVTYSDGTALASVPNVTLRSADGSYIEQLMETTPDQGFLILTPYVGDVVIAAEDPDTALTGSATGTIQSVATPLAVDVMLQPSGTVTGTVLDVSGAPVANAPVAVISSGLDFTRLTQSDNDGHYTIAHVALGELTAQAESGTQRTSNIGKLTTDGQSLTVDLQFLPTGTVQGHVVDQFGQPAADVRVTVQSRGLHGPLGPASFQAYTDSAGAYQVVGVPIGGVSVGAGNQVRRRRSGPRRGRSDGAWRDGDGRCGVRHGLRRWRVRDALPWCAERADVRLRVHRRDRSRRLRLLR